MVDELSYVLQVYANPLQFTPGASVVITPGYLLVQDAHGLASNTEILITVLTPPAHGSLTLSGAPASHFTQQDINNGLVVYNNNGTGTTDSFDLFAAVTRVTGVALPYTPQMRERDYGAGPGNDPLASPDVGAIYIGMMLDGSGGRPPKAIDISQSGEMLTGNRTTFSQSIGITYADSIVLVMSMTLHPVAGSGGSPTPCVVNALTCPGLTFTRLAGTNITRGHPDDVGNPWTVCSTFEVWWARAPVPLTNTLTVTWSSAVATQLIWYNSFTDLATPASPFDANASNFPVLVGNSGNMPLIMTAMTPTAPDHSVGVLYASFACNGNVAELAGTTLPHGYMGFGGVGGGISSPGSFMTYLARRGPAFATMPFTVSDPPPPPPGRLAMDDVMVSVSTTQLSSNLVSLRWSDDRAHSWGSPVSQSIGETGEYRTSLQWQRLGMARDRSFEISWSVALPTALQGAWIDVTPGQS